MSLSDDQKSEYLKSLCEIRQNNDLGAGVLDKMFGNGVFITPNHVLTALHVISGAQKSGLEFKNYAGETAGMLDGGFEKRDAASDLCIVELDKPIGAGVYVRPVNKHIAPEIQEGATLGRIFSNNIVGNMQVVDDVRLESLSFNSSAGVRDEEIETDAFPLYRLENEQIHEGHSGSPVLDNSGCVVTFVSLVSAFVKNAAGLSPSMLFTGPSPKKVADFVDSFLFSAESVHQPEVHDGP